MSFAMRRRGRLLLCTLAIGLPIALLSKGLVVARQHTSRQATPATLAGRFAAARPGDTILLGSGDYGTFTGGMKAGEVVLKEQPGATATMALKFSPAANITIDGLTLSEIEISDDRTKNITVRNSDIPGPTTFRTGELQNANILFDHNVHRDWNACASCGEGRIWLPENTDQPSGITIQNSEFVGGQSDGILNGSNGTRILHNTFHDLVGGSADGVHTDAIQLYGSRNTVIRGNYFYDVPDAIMSPDGADHEVIEDNVVAADPAGYPFAITLWSDDGSIIRHNTLADGACSFNLRCGIISMGSKPAADAGRGTVIEDNIFGEISFGEGRSAVAENATNLVRSGAAGTNAAGRPTYAGGAQPTSYAGFRLAPGSRGIGDASDGLDRGVRYGSPVAVAPRSPSEALSARVLSTVRSIAATGEVVVRLRTTNAGIVAVRAGIRPGRALRGPASARRVIALQRVSLGRRRASALTARLRVGPHTRRTLRHAANARLSLSVRVGTSPAMRAKLAIKR